MKAMVLDSYGENSIFNVKEIAEPKIGTNQVLVKVVASSVNPVDCKIKKGLLSVGPTLPAVIHGDMSGEVVRVGQSVTNFKKGDLVFGCVGGFGDLPGVLSEYVAVDAQLISQVPDNLSLEEAAVLPLVGITAWNGLVDRVKIVQSSKVLIHAGAGGVGHIGIQLAKILGAEVHTTISSDKKISLSKEIGADVCINYNNMDVEEYTLEYTKGIGYDVVFDTVGGCCLDDSFKSARIGGSVVSIASRSTHDLTLVHTKSLSLHVVFMLLPILSGEGRQAHGNILGKLKKYVESGQLMPKLHSKRFSFEEVEDAHLCWSEEDVMGKISLVSEW